MDFRIVPTDLELWSEQQDFHWRMEDVRYPLSDVYPATNILWRTMPPSLRSSILPPTRCSTLRHSTDRSEKGNHPLGQLSQFRSERCQFNDTFYKLVKIYSDHIFYLKISYLQARKMLLNWTPWVERPRKKWSGMLWKDLKLSESTTWARPDPVSRSDNCTFLHLKPKLLRVAICPTRCACFVCDVFGASLESRQWEMSSNVDDEWRHSLQVDVITNIFWICPFYK